MKIGVFIYDFPHLRSEKFLIEINKYAKIDLALAAPFKKLNLPKPSYDISSNKAKVSPLVTCYALNIPYIIAAHNSKETIKVIKNANLDIGIIAGGRILSKEVINAFKVGIINFHPGILPQNRGLDAMRWAIYNNLQQGITVHWIDENIDLGYKLFSQIVNVYSCDTITDISKRLLTVQLSMIEKVFKGVLIPSRVNNGRIYKLHTMMNKKEEQIVLKVFQKYKEEYKK